MFARNAMREIELFLPLTLLLGGVGVDPWVRLAGLVWCGVFVFFPLLNPDRLRVGDIVAGTWVVGAPKRRLIVDLAEICRAQCGLDVVALGGGVFQNALLLEAAQRALAERHFTVLRPRLLPPNDGGLALGQILVGAAG